MNARSQIPVQASPAPAVSLTSAPTGMLRRKCACGNHVMGGGECEECRNKPGKSLQRKPQGQREAGEVPPNVYQTLTSPGYSLPGETRAFFEPRFGHDFSNVRVHSDSSAAESAHAVNALAYTVGEHIVFGAGQYAPHTSAGRRLLAHELTHTVQQKGQRALQPQLRIGGTDDAAEAEASRVAENVISGASAPNIQQAPSGVIARQPLPDNAEQPEADFTTAQRRGGRPRTAFLPAEQRGTEQVRVVVTRYLCDCRGRPVTRTSSSARLQPQPGVTLEICRDRVTGRILGEVVPSSITTGQARIRGEINVAPGSGGTGARVGVEAEGRNTGSEPQVGGRLDARLRLPGGQQVGVGGSVFRGTQTGTIDTEVGVGADVGGVRVGVTGTNLQDPNRRSVIAGIGGNLPGQDVQTQTCRECRCPVAYECVEDTLPREYQEPVTYDVEDRSRRRYYFTRDSNELTREPVLRAESDAMPNRIAQIVAQGATIRAIVGYASPEDNRDRPTPNEQLSLSRAQRLRDRLAAVLPNVPLPQPTAGVEVFGRVATIQPGSSLADAILDTGFGGPEDVTSFLIGDDIPNAQLADQFLRLLARVTDPADRLRLFGIDEASPSAPRLLAAIEQFVARGGRGRRPWEGIFDYLRFATVELSQTRQETRMEDRRTSGSLIRMNDAQCPPHARLAESESRFGPAEPEPAREADCPSGEPRNRAGYEQKCNYN